MTTMQMAHAHVLTAGHNAQGTPPPRYIRFRLALASATSADWIRNGGKSRACSRGKFQEMRNLAYSLYGVPHVPARSLERIVLSVLVKTETDKRRMLLSDDVARAVQRKWPQVRCIVCAFLHKDARLLSALHVVL